MPSSSDESRINNVVAAKSALLLMRRIFADAQAKLRVMVEENVGAGLRLETELVDKQQQQQQPQPPPTTTTTRPSVQADQCPPVPARLNHINNNSNNSGSGSGSNNNVNNVRNNHGGSTSSSSSASSTTSTGGGSTPSSSSGGGGGGGGTGPPPANGLAVPGHNSTGAMDHAVVDSVNNKRLSSGSSPIDKRSSLSDKSVSPVDKRTSPIDRSKDPGDRASPLDRRNGSPCASPIDKQQPQLSRRPLMPALEKTRLAGSAGSSLDSHSDSASPISGTRPFFQRAGSERLQKQQQLLRPPSKQEDFLDGEPRTDDDNEPPGPAPGSRPCSPGHPLGLGDPMVASRLSNLRGHGHVELASSRRLRLENERLVAEVARLRRLLLTGASRGEVGAADESVIDDEARYVALEMELQHARETVQSLKADRKRLRAEKYDLINQTKALYATLEDKERELRDFIRNYEQRLRESEANLGRMQQPGANPEERELERERERWSLLRAARDEADRSITLAASLAEKEAALSHAHATIKELQRQLNDRGGSICLSDQESLVSFPRGSVNGAATPGAGSSGSGILASSGGGAPGNHNNNNNNNASLLAHNHGGSSGDLGPTLLGSGVGGGGSLLAGGGGTNSSSGLGSTTSGALGGFMAGDRGSCSADSGVRGSSDRESGGATSIGGNLSDSTADATTPKDCSPTLSPLNAFSRSMDNSVLSRSVEQLHSPLDGNGDLLHKRLIGGSKISSSGHHGHHQQERQAQQQQQQSPVGGVLQSVHSRSSAQRGGGTWGSISRVFARSRHRKTTSGVLGESATDAFDPYRSWSPLTEEGYAEKLRLLREAASIPMERWRAPTVLAWLEVALGMPQYGPRCAENVKSGKVLLELSDAELEAGLGVTHPLHRKKLRLAIEEHRHPNLVRYPCIGQLGHTWVSSEWLPDLGLAQYAESFATNMVDARMLDHLSKKELEKLLGVTRKFHQASIVHGINLLRMLNYDRQALAVRRHNCETVDADPLVWTNQRFIRWARAIDLAEYADNLKDSGVHGALVVLEPSFTGDTMATALGIPAAKQMIRRHLTAELEALVLPARANLEVVPRNGGPARPMSSLGSLGRGNRSSLHIQSPVNHYNSHGLISQQSVPIINATSTIDRRRSSLRGSLSRALGLRPKSDKASPSSSSETGSLTSQGHIYASCNSPPPPQLPPRPATISGSSRRHRRVKSIGDIDYLCGGGGSQMLPSAVSTAV
uniref:SAM domain-containing protein n=1 Tax=Trichogramma kaykai TaxID=54128 RepID=A0ABD2XD27_9HYME